MESYDRLHSFERWLKKHAALLGCKLSVGFLNEDVRSMDYVLAGILLAHQPHLLGLDFDLGDKNINVLTTLLAGNIKVQRLSIIFDAGREGERERGREGERRIQIITHVQLITLLYIGFDIASFHLVVFIV